MNWLIIHTFHPPSTVHEKLYNEQVVSDYHAGTFMNQTGGSL